MRKLAVYVHGKGGNATELEHYKPLLPEYDVIGFDYKSETPWDAKQLAITWITDVLLVR